MPDLSPNQQECLAHVVLADYEDWLGGPSPSRLAALLTGAVHRAQITAPDFPAWRIEGPLDDPEFYQPLVEATGHPTLTIKWATALEITHFSLTDAMQVLRLRFSEWIQSRGFDTTSVVCPP